MENIRILWSVARSNAEAGAIEIDDEIYYLYFGPGLPKIFDKSMRLLNISNIDNWISARTKQRYSMRSLKDIMQAYVEGANSAYSKQEVKDIIISCIELTIKRLCRSSALDKLNKLYWIESSSAATIDKLISKISIDFEKFRSRMGDDAIFNILCRLYKTCHMRGLDGADVCATIATRLDRSINDPVYPSVDEIKKEISPDILLALFQDSDIHDEMIDNLINNNMVV